MLVIMSKKLFYILLFIICFIMFFFQAATLNFVIETTKPLAHKRIIVIDPGHGGIDGGTNVGELLEKDINLEIALLLKEHLEQHNKVQVIMTRTKDTALDHLNQWSSSRHTRDLKARVDIINQSKADLFISLHVDYRAQQREAQGPMVLYSDRHPQNRVIATTLQQHLNKLQTSFPIHKPKKRPDLYVLKAKKTPGVIVEVGFFSNHQDRTRLQNDNYQNQLVEAIYKGIEEYFSGLKFIVD
ncbi:N-acetylmuramoyl-L-alanine amidase family protein [Halanaerobacter jeridensis]|uniref:N-acetylmuramoyl-L-alanine amidase n=1 Tax=Halanaerobacter jeridensis TaxID=706427 RepID=A0A938XSP7_9FIRM|nr:N-acetylmuramoyl-L-alanine amidase [Halanaerobacter jeridensis]MBM7555596.1 N-acetylmuramoyl-L-alanine amidase [Halanaerobacter jeridensis]